MNEALATGHRDVKEHFGTNRYYLDLYDPYYWRGAALMELGDDAAARRTSPARATPGSSGRFPEYGDLLARVDVLDRRAAAALAADATPVPAVPTPVPLAAPTAGARAALAPTRRRPSGLGQAPPIERVLVLFAAGDFDGAEAALSVLRAAHPDAREADLLQCLVLGTRYVLEGETDPLLLARARRALGAWRERGGGKRAEEALLSPSLLATLSGP